MTKLATPGAIEPEAAGLGDGEWPGDGVLDGPMVGKVVTVGVIDTTGVGIICTGAGVEPPPPQADNVKTKKPATQERRSITMSKVSTTINHKTYVIFTRFFLVRPQRPTA